ncbi:MAG: hypothetical protein MUF45_16975 [Spirosomaceae bacterium]|jgi:hypothetical protein|nr:hypothetical protein [Spirosomataceae bacterium]
MIISNYPYLAEKGKEGEKRLTEIRNLINAFFIILDREDIKSYFGIVDYTLSLAEGASEIVCDSYYKNLIYYKKFVSSNYSDDTKVNRYKIVSGLELSICEIQPIKIENIEKRRLLNAHLAFYVSLGILKGWDDEENYFINNDLYNLDDVERDELRKFIGEHIAFLRMIQSGFHLLYFSNAQTWWALKMLLKELNERRT